MVMYAVVDTHPWDSASNTMEESNLKEGSKSGVPKLKLCLFFYYKYIHPLLTW